MRSRLSVVVRSAIALVFAATGQSAGQATASPVDGAAESARMLSDGSGGADWPAFGRTYGEQHYSPLTEVNRENVSRLGLAWSYDLPVGNATTGPLAVAGTLYFASGYSVVHAVDAASGKLLWQFDPKAAEAAGHSLRQGWGSRGIAYWNGKIYTGTQDGRLIAVDAGSGKPVWSARTFAENDGFRFISGPPRVFDGKVVIGHGGADSGDVRGYVTAYDAETGKQLWRFWTVPGNPADGFENDAMKMAAGTWSGEWWKHGGGGTVWNSITYDEEFGTILLGVGNGAPWNHRIRSDGKGDNLFLSSIVAVDADTGEYRWHYQTNPGETWDYNAAMDIGLAELTVSGKRRKVALTAPKNGFLYVIDRETGRLVSAEPFAKVTWASGIDLSTGRPNEASGARFPDGSTFELWPGPFGAHSWMPMAYSPSDRLLFLPTIEMATSFNDSGIDARKWKRPANNVVGIGVNTNMALTDVDPLNGTSRLQAIDPVTHAVRWAAPTPGPIGGGVAATAGGLVFGGQLNGEFVSYASDSGKILWRFDAQAPVIAPPITYTVQGQQYVTVLAGLSTLSAVLGKALPSGIDYWNQPRRVLTFKLGGTAKLPPLAQLERQLPDDPDYRPDQASFDRGQALFGQACTFCHGFAAVAGGAAPDLRYSSVPVYAEAFAQIVHEGASVSLGMPRFEEFGEPDLNDLRHYIRAQTQELR